MGKAMVAGACAVLVAAVSCSDGPMGAGEASGGAEVAFDRSSSQGKESGKARFEFDQLRGNVRPFIGSANAIRGLSAGGLPWVLKKGEARYHDGELRVKVRGLVFDPEDPDAIARGVGGTNPVAAFQAVLSCLTVDASGAVVTVNVATQPAPATTGLGGGDADIREKLQGVPDPCIAPIVFVTSAGGSWFAATGF